MENLQVNTGRMGKTEPLHQLTAPPSPRKSSSDAGMVKRYHESFPSFSYEFDSRYPLHKIPGTFKLRQPATWADDVCILPADYPTLTKEKHMFKGLFLSLGIIVLGGIIGLPALLALAV